jgi:hypothetical protein
MANYAIVCKKNWLFKNEQLFLLKKYTIRATKCATYHSKETGQISNPCDKAA